MNRILYNIFLHTVVAPFLLMYYSPQIVLGGKYRRSLRGKLGRLPSELKPERLSRPRIWFHAVSVGEVVALGPLVKAMRQELPNASMVVSTGTETGQDRARDSIPGIDGLLFMPLDFPWMVNRVAQRIQPDLFVLMETELWPNLVHALKSRGAKVALANGRISDRSFPRYKRLRRFFATTLANIDLFLMSSDLDGSRIVEMGADPPKVRVTGNTKFDAALKQLPVGAETHVRRMFDLPPSSRVVVAGSTHPGEHEIVLDAYRSLVEKYPDLILMVVPRHLERTPQIVSAAIDRGLERPFLRSELDRGLKRNGCKIIIVDRMGELFSVFSVASVVFMGGSLVPKGGQNILEPAAWGKPVLFGPSMEDFREARDILVRSGTGIEVSGPDDLAEKIHRVLSSPGSYVEPASKARDEILRHVGSSRRNAQMLSGLLSST